MSSPLLPPSLVPADASRCIDAPPVQLVYSDQAPHSAREAMLNALRSLDANVSATLLKLQAQIRQQRDVVLGVTQRVVAAAERVAQLRDLRDVAVTVKAPARFPVRELSQHRIHSRPRQGARVAGPQVASQAHSQPPPPTDLTELFVELSTSGHDEPQHCGVTEQRSVSSLMALDATMESPVLSPERGRLAARAERLLAEAPESLGWVARGSRRSEREPLVPAYEPDLSDMPDLQYLPRLPLPNVADLSASPSRVPSHPGSSIAPSRRRLSDIPEIVPKPHNRTAQASTVLVIGMPHDDLQAQGHPECDQGLQLEGGQDSAEATTSPPSRSDLLAEIRRGTPLSSVAVAEAEPDRGTTPEEPSHGMDFFSSIRRGVQLRKARTRVSSGVVVPPTAAEPDQGTTPEEPSHGMDFFSSIRRGVQLRKARTRVSSGVVVPPTVAEPDAAAAAAPAPAAAAPAPAPVAPAPTRTAPTSLMEQITGGVVLRPVRRHADQVREDEKPRSSVLAGLMARLGALRSRVQPDDEYPWTDSEDDEDEWSDE